MVRARSGGMKNPTLESFLKDVASGTISSLIATGILSKIVIVNLSTNMSINVMLSCFYENPRTLT